MDPRMILRTALERREISAIEALILYQEGQRVHEDIRQVAGEISRQLHRNSASFVMSKTVHYTNPCRVPCRYCTYLGRRTSRSSAVRTPAQVVREIRRTPGLTEVCLQGGPHPDIQLPDLLRLLRTVREEFPRVHLHAFSPAEVYFIARRGRLSVSDVLTQMKEAGLDSMPGTGAEILNDKLRKKICPDILRTVDWIEVVKAAHRLGISTTATIHVGHIEDEIHICEHLEILRQIQRETGGFTEFVVMPFRPRAAAPGSRPLRTRPFSPEEVVRLCAISRIFFGSTFRNIQANPLLLGAPLAARCLAAGANDIGGLAHDGVNGKPLAQAARDLIRRAGFQPVQRDTLYRPVGAAKRRGTA